MILHIICSIKYFIIYSTIWQTIWNILTVVRIFYRVFLYGLVVRTQTFLMFVLCTKHIFYIQNVLCFCCVLFLCITKNTIVFPFFFRKFWLVYVSFFNYFYFTFCKFIFWGVSFYIVILFCYYGIIYCYGIFFFQYTL